MCKHQDKVMKYGNISQTLSDAGIIIIILVEQFSVLWVTELLCVKLFLKCVKYGWNQTITYLYFNICINIQNNKDLVCECEEDWLLL